MATQIDLERKTEKAFVARLKQNPVLAKLRFRHNAEDSAKVNQDLVLVAKRGEGNPMFSGIYDVEVTIALSMKYRKTADTLPTFLRLCAGVEEVLNVTTIENVGGVPQQKLAAQLSLSAPDFHCYQIALSGKDDTPEDRMHKCTWTLSIVAMSQSYATAENLQ